MRFETRSANSPGSNRYGAAWVVLAVIWLVAGTGNFSDDFALINALAGLTPSEMIWPASSAIATPLTHFTHAWFYYLIGDRQPLLYDGIKAIYLLLSLQLLRCFFSLWFPPQKSLLVAALFVFYPVHDAVSYWFIGQYLLLSFAFLAYSFYLLQTGRTTTALVAGLAGSFVSYGSSAVAAGLALIFILRRDFRRAGLLLLPNLIYIAYYLTVTLVLEKGVDRIPAGFDAVALLKQFMLQVATFADAAVGPSFWLKMLLAFGQISWPSALAAGVLLFFIARLPDESGRFAPPRDLLWGGLGVAFVAFVMFAITGRYPQLAFNLGDRVTIFGNFLVVVVIACLPLRRRQWLALLAIYLAVTFGISDHWKQAQRQQQAVIQKIRDNDGLRKVPAGSVLYIAGNQYSRYGEISHIEFLSESFVAQAVFALALRRAPGHDVLALNSRYRFDGEFMIDRKYGNKRAVAASITVYDTSADRIVEVPAAAINDYIEHLPVERRNWVQFLGDGNLRSAILYLMPRLQYAF